MKEKLKTRKELIIGKKQFTIQEPIFNRTVHVFLNCKQEEYNKFLKRNKISDDDEISHDLTAFVTSVSGGELPTEWIIFIKRFEWTIIDQGTLIHEIIHVVTRIWECNNIKFNPSTQEFFAHSVGRIYELIARKLL